MHQSGLPQIINRRRWENREITADKEQIEQIIMCTNVVEFQKGSIGLEFYLIVEYFEGCVDICLSLL